MRQILITSGIALALASAIPAQNFPFQGFLYNWDRPQLASGVSYVTRGSAGMDQVLNRIDSDDHREWGVNTMGQTQIQGFMLWIQDQDDTTVETFGVVAYNEDPARANFPLNTTPVLNIPGVPMPPTGAPPGPRLWRLAFDLTAPVMLTANQDVFLGVSLPALPSPTDGLYVGAVTNNPAITGVNTFDLPGPRGQLGGTIAQGTYVCYIVNSNPVYPPATATSLEDLAMDWMVSGGTVGGVALAQTNQTSYVSSNAPLGTSNSVSGQHPDVNGSNPGRADQIGFAVTAHTGQVPVNSPVFVMMALGPSPIGSTPVNTFPPAAHPNSRGMVCIDFANAVNFIGILQQPSALIPLLETQIIVNLNSVRGTIANIPGPLDVWWQAFVLDAGTIAGPTFEILGSGCVIQHLK